MTETNKVGRPATGRKKKIVNLSLDVEVVEAINRIVKKGQQSDYVNNLLRQHPQIAEILTQEQ